MLLAVRIVVVSGWVVSGSGLEFCPDDLLARGISANLVRGFRTG